ncbi:DUF3732 domain-containing protein [Legionella sp.]|uniref:DUF3732 domain-containing protein n=1 Tax=Legionella sp. TaxID=459 RepID=UPI003C9CD3CC
MNCFIKFIGILDHTGVTHYVEFFSGLNVITGKSSTGKSAIIEIFDYCFGSGDYTVPEGVITARADIYFTVLQFPSLALVLARRGNSNLCFIKELICKQEIEGLRTTNSDFFSPGYFIPLKDFKKELGRYFNVALSDIDENIEARIYNNGKKSPTPSIRSFMSFMLQHQNLVANKHAIFFRFDEKEKREQVIDHFKVFLGIADQEYFILSQQLNEKEQELKKLMLMLPRKAEERNKTQEEISRILDEYLAITGTNLIELSASHIITNPQQALDAISNAHIQVNILSSTFEQQRASLEQAKSILYAEIRDLQRNRMTTRASIKYAEKFRETMDTISVPFSAEIPISTCPFCESENNNNEQEANRLTEAISWLNNELRLSPYMRESFAEDERRFSAEIENKHNDLKHVLEKLAILDKQTTDLSKKRPVSELAIKARLRIEAILELLISRSSTDLELRKEQLDKEKKELTEHLNKYNMNERLNRIKSQIEDAMHEIGQQFDFEESYHPINLKFSLESFDLWHEQPTGKKIFLRTMGSGANWLYCHLTLFLALHRVFAINSKFGSKIPPILFLDQPTQVYFPNYQTDVAEEFSAAELAEGTARHDRVDEDLHAVVNMYRELIRFCDLTEEKSKIRPQIIVTDHADHLKFDEGILFESFVRARWRSRGFIAEETAHIEN